MLAASLHLGESLYARQVKTDKWMDERTDAKLMLYCLPWTWPA